MRLTDLVKNYARMIDDSLALLETIVCTVPPDDGVVMLSNDGPSHWDDEANCAVYDHEHFSPLGDALIKLHDVLGGKRPADGGDEITDDWLRQCGFDDDPQPDSVTCLYWEDDRGWLLSKGVHGQWFVYGTELPEEAWPRNRFQLRRLADSLAIKFETRAQDGKSSER